MHYTISCGFELPSTGIFRKASNVTNRATIQKLFRTSLEIVNKICFY